MAKAVQIYSTSARSIFVSKEARAEDGEESGGETHLRASTSTPVAE